MFFIDAFSQYVFPCAKRFSSEMLKNMCSSHISREVKKVYSFARSAFRLAIAVPNVNVRILLTISVLTSWF